MSKHLIKIFLLIIFYHGRSQGNFCLALNTNSAVPAWTLPKNIAYGDLNNDGQFDYITWLYGTHVGLTLSNGAGGYNNPISLQNASTFYHSADLKMADFNNDSKLDIAYADTNALDFLIYIGDGLGNFTSTVNLPSGSKPYKFIVGDFNTDSNADLAIIHSGSSTVKTYTNNGSAVFGLHQTINYTAVVNEMFFEDFNNDGMKDILLSFENNSSISIYEGSTNGVFSFLSNSTLAQVPDIITYGDYNNDGKLDIASLTTSSLINIASGNGTGGFSSQVTYTTGTFLLDVCSGDFNNDNISDLAILGEVPNDLFIFSGSSSGLIPFTYSITSLFTGLQCSMSLHHFSIYADDFNGDGKRDLMIGPDNCTSIQILENCLITNSIVSNTNNQINAILYPNPASENVFFDDSITGYYKILNSVGQKVKTGNFKEDKSILIKELDNGIYTLIIINGTDVISKRFVVRKSF